MIREFAEARGLRCRTLNSDLLDLDSRERWDLILSHYTLNFVAPDRRAKFFAGLASVLAPGGALVCAAMTGKAIAHDDEPALAAGFIARSHEAWAKIGLSPDDRAAVEDIFRIYAADTTAMRLIWPQAERCVPACAKRGWTFGANTPSRGTGACSAALNGTADRHEFHHRSRPRLNGLIGCKPKVLSCPRTHDRTVGRSGDMRKHVVTSAVLASATLAAVIGGFESAAQTQKSIAVPIFEVDYKFPTMPDKMLLGGVGGATADSPAMSG